MGIVLFFVVLGVFAALLFRFRRSNAIFILAAAAWIAAFFWNNWISGHVLVVFQEDCDPFPPTESQGIM